MAKRSDTPPGVFGTWCGDGMTRNGGSNGPGVTTRWTVMHPNTPPTNPTATTSARRASVVAGATGLPDMAQTTGRRRRSIAAPTSRTSPEPPAVRGYAGLGSPGDGLASGDGCGPRWYCDLNSRSCVSTSRSLMHADAAAAARTVSERVRNQRMADSGSNGLALVYHNCIRGRNLSGAAPGRRHDEN